MYNVYDEHDNRENNKTLNSANKCNNRCDHSVEEGKFKATGCHIDSDYEK